ncbi:MAG: hypothetical protein HOE00_05090 [Euryarchaeota archaeon]|jgi:hypothetical protein|nr:hypothetical protein [Euryarchaeota archaeon]DAC62325.1 MAG TPA: hypothetical protein D7I02_04055 [Candidatus Poseidoniales archaeon]HII12951.1 hypothetical protein [Candidatus Thalassarchaeaceae archaeon]MBT3846935.1 hypothetical protein [Euryarchaeota archaeon]MBT4156614.1 hypothetical protein [Euryarchaeota archaeon]
MAVAEIPLVQMQLAFAIGLLGVYIGWRGIIAKMTGFYDMAGAFKYLLYGIVSGMVFAVASDEMILQFGVINSQLNIATAFFVSLLIAASESALVLFLLGRPKIVALRSSTPYGWTLGLGMGAMFTSVLIVRLFDPQLTSEFSGFSILSVIIALSLAVIACVGNAEISTLQGMGVLNHQRFKTFYLSTIARSILILGLILTLWYPLIILFFAPIVSYYWPIAQNKWLPIGMTPAASQAFRRTIRQDQKIRLASKNRIRGERIFEEE